MNDGRWIVAQVGAREHYSIPRSFARAGLLRYFYTEAWVGWSRRWLWRLPGPARSLALRHHPAIPRSTVISFTWHELVRQSRLFWKPQPPTVTAQYEEYIRLGGGLATRARKDLERRTLLPSIDAFIGFSSGSLEILELLRERSIFSIVDQIDPGRVEEDLVLEECERWPGWQSAPGRIPQAYWDRLAREWELADRVLVNSDWSRRALERQGVPSSKLMVVPLSYEPDAWAAPREWSDGPLTVLWLGSVILRKGIPYLLDAARQLLHARVRFIVAGPIGIRSSEIEAAPSNVEFVGRVTRDKASELYRRSHVFVLPTISDGFAITQLEAMAHGLPVIATPCCGEVVEENVDGFIVPPRDPQAIVQRIERFLENRSLVSQMSERAIDKSRAFGIDRIAEKLEGERIRFLGRTASDGT